MCQSRNHLIILFAGLLAVAVSVPRPALQAAPASGQPGCTYAIDPSAASFTLSGGTGQVRVTASGEGCRWTARSGAAWVRITDGARGTGSGVVSFAVAPKASLTARSAPITIAGRTFRVTQAMNDAQFRALHLGGNWGINFERAGAVPAAFLDWLRATRVNWVGISQALIVTDSLDSQIRLEAVGPGCPGPGADPPCIPSFTDDALRSMIRAFRSRGIHVYVTLAMEDLMSRQATHPVHRWQLGDPAPGGVDPAYWPWDPAHPSHAAFVSAFWASYTDAAVHVAQLAEQEGVELLSLGTETDRLFRTRSGGVLAHHYAPQLQALVSAVRAVYQGQLAYDMHYSTLTNRGFYGNDADLLPADLGLDISGVSAYFQLLPSPVTGVPSVATLEAAWSGILSGVLQPLRDRNPGRPVVLLECGYVDSLQSPAQPNANEFEPYVFSDVNANRMDDGRETQANVYDAMFRAFEADPTIVQGAFLWGHDISTRTEWADWWGKRRHFGTRLKPAEAVIRAHYTSWARR